MFYIKRKHPLPKALRGPFHTYEKARSAVRCYLRKTVGNFRGNNPSISEFGFSIQKT